MHDKTASNMIDAETEPRMASELGTRGVLGVAINGVPFVSEHFDTNGKNAHTSLNFDDCGGHMLLENNGYHYHLAPSCLMRSLNGTAPDGSWVEQMKNWPLETDTHSPLVGYALDGFPIYGPNGDGGVLMQPASADRALFETKTIF